MVRDRLVIDPRIPRRGRIRVHRDRTRLKPTGLQLHPVTRAWRHIAEQQTAKRVGRLRIQRRARPSQQRHLGRRRKSRYIDLLRASDRRERSRRRAGCKSPSGSPHADEHNRLEHDHALQELEQAPFLHLAILAHLDRTMVQLGARVERPLRNDRPANSQFGNAFWRRPVAEAIMSLCPRRPIVKGIVRMVATARGPTVGSSPPRWRDGMLRDVMSRCCTHLSPGRGWDCSA